MATDRALLYQLIPTKTLPILDLRRSFGGEIARWFVPEGGSTHRWTRSLETSDSPVERMSIAKVFLVLYGWGHLLAGITCFVPASVGSVCAVVGLTLALPGSLTSLVLLRWDVLKLLLRSYDVWFYTFVNSVGAVLIARGFADARACVAVILWLGNLHTILVDANTRLVAYLVVASSMTLILNAIVLFSLETHAVHDWTPLVLKLGLRLADHLEGENLISNCVTTMATVLARTIFRRYFELSEQKKIGCPMLRCLSWRCAVGLQPLSRDEVARLARLTAKERAYYMDPSADHTCSVDYPMSQMYYVRHQAVIDAGQTFFHALALPTPLEWAHWMRVAYIALGAVGLTLTAAVFGAYPSTSAWSLVISGLSSTFLFFLVSVGLFNRHACASLLKSFDYLFLSWQLSFGLWCASMLFMWDARSVALASMWLWLHWVITIDALTPPMKHKIGTSIKLLIVPVLVLFIAAEISVVVELVWINRWHLVDEVLVTLFGRIVLRLMPFFVSRLVLTFLWSLRLLWRVVRSQEGDSVIQLGRVGYLYTNPAAAALAPDQAKRIEVSPRKPSRKPSAKVHVGTGE